MFKRTKTALCLTAVLNLAAAMPAAANNTQTINTSNDYVDISIAAAFTTIPTLCTENIGEQGQSLTGCDALGTAAVEAANGSGISPDQYWEARFPDGNPNTVGTGTLQSKNSFVPNNGSAEFGDSGYAPVFSQHKYNLFGRGDEQMGPLSREEILFVGKIGGNYDLVSQTQPGDAQLWDALTTIMTLPPGNTTVTFPDGTVFDIANLTFYTDITGVATGGTAVANAFCISYYDSILPGSGAIFCPILSIQSKVDLYLTENAYAVKPNLCAGSTVPNLHSLNCIAREQWVDQVVVGYMESFDDPNNPTTSLMQQNFRSQMNFDPTQQLSLARTLSDFNMEQDVTLGGNAFEGSRQTMQQAFSAASTPSIIFSMSLGQLVTQDTQGWLYSCLNCDSTLNSVSHAFTPTDLNLTFMPYTNTWRDLPSISHGESGGNLSVYAQAPGDPGP
jgi:hypothetical protein